jgi:hypothetical protein
VTGEVQFEIHDARGVEILDELQLRTGATPYLENTAERRYRLSAGPAGVAGGFDELLETIDPDWAQHLSRIP